MGAVRQLDEHHAHVLGHGEKDLAQVFRLQIGDAELRRQALLLDGVQLCDAVHQAGDILAELLADGLQGDIGIFHYVMENGRGDGLAVESQVRQQRGYRLDMLEIGLARGAFLPVMGAQGDLGGLADDADFILRPLGGQGLEPGFQIRVFGVDNGFFAESCHIYYIRYGEST